ncbi:MAG: serine hydrolase domain-containing protein [Thermoleophilia bacterium]
MRRTVVTILIAVLALSLAAGCGDDSDSADEPTITAPAITLPEGDLPAAEAAKADRAAAAIMKAGANAAYVGIWDPGKGSYTVAAGEAAPGRAATVDDNWRIGSITKTFTATVILELVDEGKLALDDTVEAVDPDLAGRFPPFAKLTIRQLLSMQSGIGDYFNSPKGIAPQVAADPSKVWTPDELIAGGITVGVAKPGTAGYSTTNYIVLQEIAVSLTGQPLTDAIRDRVTEPLGLEDTFLPPPEDSAISDPSTNGTIGPLCALELEQDGATDIGAGEDVTSWSVSSGAGGGAMQSNLADLATWAASTSGNALLDPATATERTTTQLLPELIEYGLGIMQVGLFYGHEGEEFGWEALALHNPDSGQTVVLAGNACGIGGVLMDQAGRIFPDAAGL